MDREKVINKVTAIVADMQEEVDEWKDYSDSELRGGLTCDCDWWYKTLQTLKNALALLKAQEPITGETSDGYHTFNELYHHRAVLFSVIVANYKDRAWKSVRHHDGTMYDGMFIVGIDTPDGQATYHYDIDPYWDMFDCKVREFAPEWDGHTPAQAIERIGKLKVQEAVEPTEPDEDNMRYCGACGSPVGYEVLEAPGIEYVQYSYCPNCGKKVKWE